LRSAVRLRREPGKCCHWHLRLFALLTADAHSDRRCRLPCAVETRSGPSDAPRSLRDFAQRGATPCIWWTWAESNRRPAHIYVNFQGQSPHDHFPLQADQSPGELVEGALGVSPSGGVAQVVSVRPALVISSRRVCRLSPSGLRSTSVLTVAVLGPDGAKT